MYELGSGNLQGDRWGLIGSEDVGGGLKAIFRLEGGFNVDNGMLGQGGAEFGRKAYVGLASPVGTVTLGRQYDLLVLIDDCLFRPLACAVGTPSQEQRAA